MPISLEGGSSERTLLGGEGVTQAISRFPLAVKAITRPGMVLVQMRGFSLNKWTVASQYWFTTMARPGWQAYAVEPVTSGRRGSLALFSPRAWRRIPQHALSELQDRIFLLDLLARLCLRNLGSNRTKMTERSCTRCLKRIKSRRTHRKVRDVDKAMHVLHIDTEGPLTRSDDGFVYFLVGALRLPGFPLLIDVWLLRSRTSAEVCHQLDVMFAYFESLCFEGFPLTEAPRTCRLHSNRAGEFTAAFFENFLAHRRGICRTLTTGYDPQANGTAERFVGLIKALPSRCRVSEMSVGVTQRDMRLNHSLAQLYNDSRDLCLLVHRSSLKPWDMATSSIRLNGLWLVDWRFVGSLVRSGVTHSLSSWWWAGWGDCLQGRSSRFGSSCHSSYSRTSWCLDDNSWFCMLQQDLLAYFSGTLSCEVRSNLGRYPL